MHLECTLSRVLVFKTAVQSIWKRFCQFLCGSLLRRYETGNRFLQYRCGNRDFVFLLTSNNINVRFRPQWSLDNVGVEMVSHRLQPNIVSGSLFAQISKQFVGIEFKISSVNVGSEIPIRCGKVAPN